MNVGVHFGTAIVGTLLGEPATITAIGDTVNMANRIEQANKAFGTRMLVSDAARAEIGDTLGDRAGVQLHAAGQGRRVRPVRSARPGRRTLTTRDRPVSGAADACDPTSGRDIVPIRH